jgi:hypothetical protein
VSRACGKRVDFIEKELVMVFNTGTLQETAEQLALKQAGKEYPGAKAHLLSSHEHMHEGVWVVQLEVRDNGSVKTPFYRVRPNENRARNVFPEHSNVFHMT